MENALIVFNQLLVMLFYMLVGWLLCKRKLITAEGSKALANLLIYCILPCAIIKSLNVEATPEKVGELLSSFGMVLVALVIAMAVSGIVYRKKPVDNFASSFSNAGFMGIPLISAVLGGGAVFYICTMVAMLNALQWTYGQYIISGRKDTITLKGIICNPFVISCLAGLVLFFLPVQLPAKVSSVVDSIAACNAPVAMIVLGVYLANVDLKGIFVKPANYLQSAVRLLIIPVLTAFGLALFPVSYEIRSAVLIAACAPVGSNVAVYAQRLGLDNSHAVETVCLSTLLSVVTMPLVILLANIIW